MAFGSSSSARALARAALVPTLPPLLRVCVDEHSAGPGAIERIGRDIVALVPDLVPLVNAWVDRVRETSDLTRAGVVEARTRLLAALDREAAERDCSRLRAFAELVLAVSSAASDVAIATRLAGAAWRDLEELWRIDTRVQELGAGRELWMYDIGDRSDLDPDVADCAEATSRASSLPDAKLLAAIAVDLRADARIVALGLSSLAVGAGTVYENRICEAALAVGRELSRPLESRAASRERALLEERERRRAEEAAARDRLREEKVADAAKRAEAVESEPVPPGHVVVCPRVPETGADRARSATRGYEAVIHTPIPLVTTPDLARVRETLRFEFPHAAELVDRVITDLVGRPTIHLPPILLTGRPGAGKSRFVRRLAETLGVGLLRVDGARDTGAAIAGLDRRWSSTEPSHPLMAINRFKQANPLVLIDEIDKAPTRDDWGRLWDGLLALLETENAARFADPCLQVETDLSHVSYIATANDAHRLPAPLLDRMRELEFPLPRAGHLEALLPALVSGHAVERSIDPRWIAPLAGCEIDLLRRAWRGGSVRRLQRLVATVLQAREADMPRH